MTLPTSPACAAALWTPCFRLGGRVRLLTVSTVADLTRPYLLDMTVWACYNHTMQIELPLTTTAASICLELRQCCVEGSWVNK